MAAMQSQTAGRTDLEELRALNDDYIQAVQHGDVRRFDEILADDFLASNPDGSLVAAHDVRVRILGDVAIIHARTSFTTVGGEQRNGRYTDIWARRNGRWLAVAAHVTRQVTAPAQ
jgi:ketosteroid isomerase-like protein